MQYKWTALSVVSIGSLMGAIDSTVLLIAFPRVAVDLGASLVEMVWVLMIYILMGTALVLSLGRISDMKGRKRLYNAGFVVFIVGSALCGLSLTGLQLVAFRAIQGIGGAMLVANSFAILSDAFPPQERGKAFGIISVVWGTGSISGIILGGLIVSFTTWRWIFWINVPIGVVGTALAFLYLREQVTPNPRETFDLPAAILFTGALSSFLLGITEGILTSWTDPRSLGPLLAGIPLLAGFIVWEGRVSKDPILPFSMFRRWLFSASLISSVLQGIALFAANFLLMIYFQVIRGVPVLTAAYLIVPLPVALAAVGPLGGRLSDRVGARLISTVGLAIQASVFLVFSTLTPSTPLWMVGVYEASLGIGGGLFFPANTSAIMSSSPRERYGVASGVMMTLRNSAMAISFAVALIAVAGQLPAGVGAALFGGTLTAGTIAGLHLTPAALDSLFLSGMSNAFRLSAGLIAGAAVFSALRGREARLPVPAPQQAASPRPVASPRSAEATESASPMGSDP